MLKKILLGLGAVLALFIAYSGYVLATTKNHSPANEAVYNGSSLFISVQYCQPYKKDRLIFGSTADGALLPYGVKWRTGANEATEIEFSNDVMISGSVLKKGRYTLYSIPAESRWTIAFNNNLDYWGAGISDPFDESKDALRVEVPVINTLDITEQFEISFEELMDNNAIMTFKWDQTQVNVPISKL
jgi:hypothetical protein